MPATRAKTPEKRVRRTTTKKTVKPAKISTLAEFNAMIDSRIYGGESISLAEIMDERLKVLGY
jgi:hypothetical protein